MEKGSKSQPISLLSCLSKGTTARSSSVLNRNVPLYGPSNALDITNISSCWNSDQAPTNATLEQQQTFEINFNRAVLIRRVKFMFQGGFVPIKCQVSTKHKNNSQQQQPQPIRFEMEDRNDFQDFDLPSITKCDSIRFCFGDSTDFYGRMTIYKLEVWGWEVEEEG